MDLISQLGELALASRLKRLSDRLMREVSRVYKEQSLDFEARLFPVLFYLRMEGPSNITTIARGLNLTHPAVTQVAHAMTRRKLVRSRRVARDERQRELVLTEKGLKLVSDLQPVWDEVAGATRELLEETKVDLVKHLERVEAALDERDMFLRVADRLVVREIDSLEVIPYEPRYKRHFADLNREWLEDRFTVEDEDRLIIDDPNTHIIKPGGMVFFARLVKQIVGTVAVNPIPDSTQFELSKMAVAEGYRGHGIGRRLAEATLEYAAQQGATQVVLATSPQLMEANRLYQSMGFVADESNPLGKRYTRKTITMALEMETVKKSG